MHPELDVKHPANVDTAIQSNALSKPASLTSGGFNTQISFGHFHGAKLATHSAGIACGFVKGMALY
jgi:hypothetical protein